MDAASAMVLAVDPSCVLVTTASDEEEDVVMGGLCRIACAICWKRRTSLLMILLSLILGFSRWRRFLPLVGLCDSLFRLLALLPPVMVIILRGREGEGREGEGREGEGRREDERREKGGKILKLSKVSRSLFYTITSGVE